MNETLKGVAHIGAELAAAKADLQLEMERHRKTWRQLEQVTGLLKRAKWKLWTSPGDTLPDEITAALSQQAEPVCDWPTCECALDPDKCKVQSVEPAPAQDEREAFEARMILEAGPGAADLWIKGNPGAGYSNERVNDYRFGWVACLEWMSARPAQTAPQPEQSGLVETLERVKLTDEEARHHSFSAVAYWNNAVTACISALSATPATAASNE